ncbi:MAG: sensor histidine kinase [Bacteroidales bacterium]|nr:sensor histidine kinase [Bacteroidales bacterium]
MNVSQAPSSRISYPNRLFLLLMLVSWVLVGCFLGFQYGREKEYKASQLNQLLQYYNHQMLDELEHGGDARTFERSHNGPLPHLRVSVIDRQGHVAFDNSLDSVEATGSHLDRPEIAAALEYGEGYTVRRHSTTTDATYFYSALAGDSLIVRSAAPYDVSLTEMLDADKVFLWFMVGVTLIISLMGFIATRSLGHTITRLSRFAQRAESGEPVLAEEAFPRGELGDIARHIVNLYVERDRQHAEAIRQQQEAARIKRQLTNNINHELKTPLAAIQLCLETLLAHPTLDTSRRQQLLERAYANSERLHSLLVDVATLTRLDDGYQSIPRQRLNLSHIVEEVAHEYTDMGLPIHLHIQKDLWIEGNEGLLATALRNLINNANAYSGGTKIDITLQRLTDGEIELAVEDDGHGVDAEHLPHLFERFYRVDKGRSRANGGTGLGLAIVKNAAAFHGGAASATLTSTGALKVVIRFKKAAPIPN